MENLIKLLNKLEVNYKILKHNKKIKSAKDGQNLFNIELGQTAPTLILSTEKGYFALIFSGKRKSIDFKNLETVLKCGNIQLASKKEVFELTGFQVGAVPLINPSLRTIIDKQLFIYSDIYGGTGNPFATLKIAPQDLKKFNNITYFIE